MLTLVFKALAVAAGAVVILALGLCLFAGLVIRGLKPHD